MHYCHNRFFSNWCFHGNRLNTFVVVKILNFNIAFFTILRVSKVLGEVCTGKYVCMYVCMHVYVCMYVCMYGCIYGCACMFVCMFVCMYVCTCVCTYVRSYILFRILNCPLVFSGSDTE